MEVILQELLQFSLARISFGKQAMCKWDLYNMMNLTKHTLQTWELELLLRKMTNDANRKLNFVGSLLAKINSGEYCITDHSTPSNDVILKNNANNKIHTGTYESSTQLNFSKNEKESYEGRNSENEKLQLIVEKLVINCSEFPSCSIGKYTSHVRIRKILTYKLKRLLKRKILPVSRRFIGRSEVAKQKLRYRGRFVRKDSVTKKSIFKVNHKRKCTVN